MNPVETRTPSSRGPLILLLFAAATALSGCGQPSSAAVGKGSGQGLAIARSIVVEQHQGEIDFTSVAGEGTIFCIRIPVDAAEDSEAA